MKSILSAPVRLVRFYYDGFTGMSSWGKKVWIIIIIKFIIIFAVLRIFFFPDFLRKNFDNDKERSDHILNQLTYDPDIYV